MKPRNYRMHTSENGRWVVRASTAWLYFAVPLFGCFTYFTLWWLVAVIVSLFFALAYGRDLASYWQERGVRE